MARGPVGAVGGGGGRAAAPRDERVRERQRAQQRQRARQRQRQRAHGNGNGGHGNGYPYTAEAATELAALLGSGSAADLQRREDDLRAERDERLTRAWRADLEACEARRRRDDLATAAGVDPVRAGDRAFVTALLDVARTEMAAARAALAEHGTADEPTAAPAVARADEEVDAAEAQLRRMEQLRRTTALTRRYLARAQEQTHRDIAPVLAATLRDWLPGVTRGRYVDALVDPETLAVQVYGPSGRWRPADRLSVGTADQVYLLLRVALAQHLATSGETCPLLLDGVTAQADGERTTEILDLLLKLAPSARWCCSPRRRPCCAGRGSTSTATATASASWPRCPPVTRESARSSARMAVGVGLEGQSAPV